MGMQVSCSMDTEISKEDAVWAVKEVSWRSDEETGHTKGERCYRGSSDVGSHTYAHIDPAEVFGISGDRVYEGEECNTYSSGIHGSEKEFYWSALLGQGLLCEHSRIGRGDGPIIHQEAGARRQAARADEHVQVETKVIGSNRFERFMVYTSLRLCRRS